MANKMGIIHHFLIKIETEGKTIQNYEYPLKRRVLSSPHEQSHTR